MKIIPTHSNAYGDAFQTEDIRIVGGHSTTIYVHPYGGRRVHQGPIEPEPMAYCAQHAHVIDCYGGSGAERERMTVEVELGEPFIIGGFPGIWQMVERDRRKLEGDGYKLIPATLSDEDRLLGGAAVYHPTGGEDTAAGHAIWRGAIRA